MGKRLIKIVAIIISSALITSCTIKTVARTNTNSIEIDNKNKSEIIETKENDSKKMDKTYSSSVKPNELGKIMILMYHDIGEKEGEWVRTPENFKKDLETLYEKGYRLISIKDYINNNIDIPEGTTPVILTFDDGTLGQFNMIKENGEYRVDNTCAVGILEDFYKLHPDFGLKATFYVYYPVPFRQKELIEKKFRYLIDNGMDIGNHTYNHENLRKLNTAGIQESLGKNVMNTKKYLPDYEVDSLALPYGIKPKDNSLIEYVIKGEYKNTIYNNKIVLLVGSNPAYPIYHIKTKPDAIPRIRASEMDTYGTGLYDWLDYFDKHPEEKFISDGNANIISVPADKQNEIYKDKVNGKEIVLIK
ncbi:polysaccharide deacetylase [Caloramator sp. E03]|uniref:polysaccharide deacetylase family protein n=1 Tax=Caloramator sp. E03 TaxID=2576307 RepID=UPI00111057F4|nr:polysaccharide deacetylase family protein [Caloramator sp. E03]QCX34538.1 polysaccharide deacetylase [Caloramator sp. E03]